MLSSLKKSDFLTIKNESILESNVDTLDESYIETYL